MTSDVTIEIMGECEDIEHLLAIIEAAEEDACEYDWGHAAETSDIVASFKEAVENAKAFTLLKSDTTSIFNNVREACRNAGLNYIVSYGPMGEESFSDAIFYRAGGEEFEIPLDAMSEVIPMRDVREAAEIGIHAVRRVIADYDRKVLKDVEQTFVVPEAVVAEIAARTNPSP
jgi:hypothetical protein